MIIIFSNNYSGLWGVFSGNILGIETLVITQGIEEKKDFNGFSEDFYGQLWQQSQTFGNKIYNYQDININENSITIGNNLYLFNDIFIIKYENFHNIDSIYEIKTTNFIQECNNISEIIGIIYNKIPNKPPLNSIPHSTSLLKS